MPSASNGSKLVGAAVAATLTALGVGTIYLPFIADKDKVRGLHEDGDMTAAERKQFKEMMAKMQAEAAERKKAAQGGNSMWSRLSGGER